MIDIDRTIKVLEQSGLADCEAEAKEVCEALEYAINNLKMKQWMIDRYEHEVDLLEQDLKDTPEVWNRNTLTTKLIVYRQVLKDLTAEDCEE